MAGDVIIVPMGAALAVVHSGAASSQRAYGSVAVQRGAREAMNNALLLAVRRLHDAHDLDADGVVVPATIECIAAVVACAEEGPVVVRDGSFTDAFRAAFTILGIPIFFAGSDGGIDPFAITRRPHRGT